MGVLFLSYRIGKQEIKLLNFLKDNSKEFSITDIAKNLDSDQGNTSRRIIKLEQLNYIESYKNSNNNAFGPKFVKITSQGIEFLNTKQHTKLHATEINSIDTNILKQMVPAFVKHLANLEFDFTEEEINRITELYKELKI